MEQEYVILQCPACERSVKIKSDTAGSRMGCPYCKEPIEIAGSVADEATPEPVEDEQATPPSLAFRRIQPTEPTEGLESQPTAASASEVDQAGEAKPKGERRRHRSKHQADALAWDAEPSADGQRKLDKPDEDDDSSEFLEMDPNSPGGVRLKRVRRKKILSGKDKFFRVATAAIFLAAAVIAGFIIYSAVMQTSKVIGTEAKTLQELPEEIRVLIEQAKVTPITDDLTQAEEEIAASVLSGFLNAKTIDERLRFVRNQEQVRPLMEEWYAKHPEEATKEWPDGTILHRKKIIDQGRHFIILAVEFVGIGKRVMAVEQKPGGEMRLDWETTVGYQPMPLEEFKTLRPEEAVKFWVKLKPSDYYNFQFSDADKYRAVELSYPGNVDFKLVGYIDRTKEWAAPLIERLESGEGPSLIVTLRYPAGQPIQDDAQVEIASIVSETWWP